MIVIVACRMMENENEWIDEISGISVNQWLKTFANH